MKSRWFHLRPTALALRESGLSINAIESKLGIPRSTLSGWFKNVQLDDTHRARLQKNKEIAWAKARVNATLWHKAQKAARIAQAEHDAQQLIARLPINNDLLELALAMLYLGEGKKSQATSIANTNPTVLNFVLNTLSRVYGVQRTSVKCELHLRYDQDEDELKKHWSEILHIPLQNFSKSTYDHRTSKKASFEHYKGVCVLNCGNIHIQRKLISLYNLFCKRVANDLKQGD